MLVLGRTFVMLVAIISLGTAYGSEELPAVKQIVAIGRDVAQIYLAEKVQAEELLCRQIRYTVDIYPNGKTNEDLRVIFMMPVGSAPANAGGEQMPYERLEIMLSRNRLARPADVRKILYRREGLDGTIGEATPVLGKTPVADTDLRAIKDRLDAVVLPSTNALRSLALSIIAREMPEVAGEDLLFRSLAYSCVYRTNGSFLATCEVNLYSGNRSTLDVGDDEVRANYYNYCIMLSSRSGGNVILVGDYEVVMPRAGKAETTLREKAYASRRIPINGPIVLFHPAPVRIHQQSEGR